MTSAMFFIAVVLSLVKGKYMHIIPNLVYDSNFFIKLVPLIYFNRYSIRYSTDRSLCRVCMYDFKKET